MLLVKIFVMSTIGDIPYAGFATLRIIYWMRCFTPFNMTGWALNTQISILNTNNLLRNENN